MNKMNKLDLQGKTLIEGKTEYDSTLISIPEKPVFPVKYDSTLISIPEKPVFPVKNIVKVSWPMCFDIDGKHFSCTGKEGWAFISKMPAAQYSTITPKGTTEYWWLYLDGSMKKD